MPTPLVFADACACGPELMRFADRTQIPDIDRRKTVRLALSLPLYIYRAHDRHPLETKTKNVSTGGFYCFLDEPFWVGESVRCVVVLQTFDPERPTDAISLECQAKVVRVEPAAGGGYGMAFRILDYRVLPRLAGADPAKDGH